MTETELKTVKEKSLFKRELENIKERILLLEQDPKVKEYILLTKEKEEKSKIDTLIKISRENSNNLLFEYGRFSLKENLYDYYVSAYLYRDLETQEFFWYTSYYVYKKIYKLDIKEKEEFEMKNIEFEKMREYFLNQLLDKPQEQVVYEVVDKNKQLAKVRKNELLF